MKSSAQRYQELEPATLAVMGSS